MADTIKIGNLDISSFKVGSGDCTVYLGTTLLYSGGTTPPTPSFDGKFKLTYSNDTVYSAECDSTSAITYSETSGGTNNFSGVTSIVVGDCVTSIEENAFSCHDGGGVINTNELSVTLGSGLEYIKNGAFQVATIPSLTIPSSVIGIEEGAFETSTNAITNLTFEGNEIINIGYNSFVHRNKQDELVLPYCSNTYNGNGAAKQAFASNSTVKSVRWKQNSYNKGMNIGESMFENCTSLSSVTLPTLTSAHYSYSYNNNNYSGNNAHFIKANAFARTALREITIPSGWALDNSSQSVFMGCTGLTNATINCAVSSLSYNFFSGCTSLSSVTINSTINFSILEPFNNCTSLASFTIPTNCTSAWLPNGNIARTYYIGSNITTINLQMDGTPNVATIVPTVTLTESDYASMYQKYNWRYIIDTLHYLTMPYTFTITGSSVGNVCQSGNLYDKVEQGFYYNNTWYPIYDEGGNIVTELELIEEGSSECVSSGGVYSSWGVYQASGSVQSRYEITDTDSDITVSCSNGRLKINGYSTSAITSGGSDTYTVTIDEGSNINSICFIANSNTNGNYIASAITRSSNDYDVTSGTCTVTKTDGTTNTNARYVLAKYNGENQTNTFGGFNFNRFVVLAIGINQDDSWGTAYTVENP